MFYLILCAFIVSLAHCQFTLANTAKSLSSYQTLASGVSYELNFTLSKVITAGNTLSLSFPSEFRIPSSTLTDCRVSTLTSVTPSASTCSSVYSSGLDQYSIIYSNVYTTGGSQTFIWLKFNINNPWGQTSSRIDVYIKDGSSQTLQSTTFFIDYTASIMTGCSYTGSTGTTGQNTTHIVKFTPSRDLIANSYLVITMPFWFIGTSTNISSSGSTTLVCSGLQNTDFPSLTCSLTNSSTSDQLITINDFVSTNKTSPGQVQIKLDTLRNPCSLYPFGPIRFEIYYQSLIITQRCTGIYETTSQSNNFKNLNFNIPSVQISAANSGLTSFITVNNPLPKNKTLLKVEYPSEILISYSGTAYGILSQNSTQLLLTNISPTNDRLSGSFSITLLSITTPPSTRAFTFKFTALYNVSGVYYEIDTISKTFQNNAGAITSVTVLPTDTSINVITSYTVNFKLTNKMVNGGNIQIVFPSTLNVDPTAICSDNVLNTSTCVVSSNNLTITVNGSLASGSSLTVIVDKVKNAGESIQSGTFKIYSYYDGLSDSLVDKIETGITVTMTANLIATASVTPSNLTTYSVTSYKIDFTLKDSITQNGYIEIQFPSAVVPLAGSVVLMAASFSTSTCTLSLSESILKILNCFLSAPMNVFSTSVTIGGIQNPQSFKPTDTFKIRTFSALPSLTNYISSGIIVTMSTPYQLSIFSITPLLSTVHADTKQTLNIVHVIPLSVNDYLLVNFDPSMTISTSLTCSSLSGITTITCTKINSSQLKIAYTSSPSSQTLRFDINTVVNYDIAQTAIPFTAVLYSSDNFIKQQASTSFTYVQDTITVFSVNNDDKIILYDYSQVTLTLSSPFTIGSSFDATKTMLQVILPTGITTAANTTCTVPSGTCSIPQNTKLQVTSVGLGLASFSIVMTNILLPYIATQSGSFSITLYYDNKKVSTVSTGVVIQPYCTSPCKACSVIKAKCLSCLPSPNTLEFYNPTLFSCLTVCPDGTYPDALKICQNCVSPCLTCTDVAVCLSCVANTWLAGQSCASTCPDRFYNASNGKCQACVDPCDKCKSQTECLSCKTGFYYNFTCLAAGSCPSGTYANASTLNCENCTSPCASCSNTGSNCTSCVTPNLYYDANCVSTCPGGMYPSGGNCLNCTGLCNTCLNGSYCLSCTSNFYYSGSCVVASSCPSGTFANSNNLRCDSCTSPCATCSNTATNCTSCVSPNLYYDGVCAATCPNGMYPSGNNCSNCTGLCSTCSNSSYCLSCTTDYYFNGTCVLASNCPSGTFPDSTQMKCVNCPTGCTACVSLTNCTACNTATYIFYNDQCLTLCPDGTFKSGTSCVNCSPSCSTCQNTSTSCTGCPTRTFLYNKSCSATCPIGMYEDVDKCTSCKPQCATCSDGTSCLSCGTPFFLTPSGQCSTTCPLGKFGNSANNQCQSCTSPCTSCQLASTNCTACLSSLILFQGQCLSSCPSQYFNVNGSCQTCSNCNNCLSPDSCGNCSSGYFLYAQQCYTTCPNIAPIQDYTSKTCTVCDSSCLTCVGTNTNCTSCPAGLYLFNSGCLSACPSGLVEDPTKGTCDTKQISSIFYFPTMFSAVAIFLILLYSKLVYKETEFITALTGLLSILCFVSWVIFLVILQFFESSLNSSIITLFTVITLSVICLSVLIGATYQVYLCFAYKNDSGFKCWIDLDTSNSIIHKVVIIGSLFTFIFYRFLFGRLFHRVYFSLSYTEGQKLLSQTHRIALLSIFTQFLPIVGISFYTVYSKEIYDQTVYSALDTLILNVIMVILLIIQGSKSGSEYFGQVAKKTSSLYETKGKYMEVDSSMSIIDIDEQEVRKVKRLRTQVAQQQKDTFFRRITCIDNLNRYGHLNQFILKEEEHSKSLPEMKQLLSHPQYNINGEDEIDVADGLFFVDENEQTYRIQKQKMIQAQQRKAQQQKQKGLQQQKQQRAKKVEDQLQKQSLLMDQKVNQRKSSLAQQLFHQQPSQINLITLDDKLGEPNYKEQQQQEEEQFRQFQQSIEVNPLKHHSNNNNQLIQSVPTLSRLKQQQQQRLEKQRLQKMLQDQLQQDNIECVDIVAIDKVENKNSIKKSPLDFLTKFKTVDDKPIDQKATKKLQEIAKKNGIDPSFMKQTFGVQKHHNQQLLNSIIDKHHHVNRQAVKQMFKQTNNKEILQQLFSKNSTLDTDKLKELMNEKNGVQMIEKLMDQQKGIISPNIAKTLLDKNSKFKPQFTKKLLNGESGADESKIQQLLRNGDSEKVQQQNLKALKKIGGDNLQNTKLIENMLGPQSNLDIDQFAKVASNLSTKALQSIFNNKNPQTNKVINKILNNKKLNLKSLSTIFEDEELIYELGKKLSGDDPILQENINNLLKNCGQNTDPQKLKEFLENQVLVKKLMQNSVIDPQFLNQVLNKDSNSNIDLIEKTLNQMPQEDVKKIFEFTGQKNIDYKAISKIFEDNYRTDPELVKKMLDPQLVEQVFTKNNKINSNMLQKLVQKGSKFDKDNIVNIYGKNTDNFLSNRGDTIERQGRSTQRNKDSNSNRGQEKNKMPKSNSAFQMPKNKENQTITKNQSVPSMMPNKQVPYKDLNIQSKNTNEPMSFEQAIKNREIVDILKNGNKNDILKNEAFQKMVKDGSLSQMMRKTFNGKSLVSSQNGETIDFKTDGQFIKSNPNGSKINVKPSGQTQMTKSNGQKVKISKDGQITVFGKNGQILKQGTLQQINLDGTFDQFIQNQSFGQIKQMIKNGTFNEAIKNGKLGEIIQNKALEQLIENGTLLNALNRNQSNNSNGVIFDPENNQTEYDFKMTFNKTANDNFALSQNGQIRSQQVNQMIMSRTDGGMMGFLNPLKLKENKIKSKPNNNKKDDWDDLDQRIQDLSEDQDQQQIYRTNNDDALLQEQQEGDQEFIEKRKRKSPMKKKKPKKITDIRHPAQKIYLEPILAPHQVQSKSFRKKKKKDQSLSGIKLIMDEDNDVFDIDF